MAEADASGIDRESLADWLALIETPGIGRVTARRLLAALGSPTAVLDAPMRTLRDVVGQAPAQALSAARETHAALIETTWQWLQAEPGRQVLVLGDPRYPAGLLECGDPPLLLYAVGRLELLQRAAIAMVGSRSPTPQGKDNARAFAMSLSAGGITVVSGLALGVDAAAHEGALAAFDESPASAGSTIAVVGTGLDRVYPKRNHALTHRIARDGLVLSEFALGTPPLEPHFPQRNRIIAGLARGTLVVEAAVQSGSLITARQATEMGREVFAIPGSIHSPQSRGCHALIRQGAKLVESTADILEELPGLGMAPPPRQGAGAGARAARSQDPDPVLAALGHDPVGFDELLARTGWPASELSAHLLNLELSGTVARMPGSQFQRVGTA